MVVTPEKRKRIIFIIAAILVVGAVAVLVAFETRTPSPQPQSDEEAILEALRNEEHPVISQEESDQALAEIEAMSSSEAYSKEETDAILKALNES